MQQKEEAAPRGAVLESCPAWTRTKNPTLYQSSQGWHEGAHTLAPWTLYFLGVLLAAYEDFEERVGQLTTRRGAKTQRIRDAVGRLPDGFKTRDVERLCPSVSRSLIRKVFSDLKEEGHLRAEGRGPAAVWRKD